MMRDYPMVEPACCIITNDLAAILVLYAQKQQGTMSEEALDLLQKFGYKKVANDYGLLEKCLNRDPADIYDDAEEILEDAKIEPGRISSFEGVVETIDADNVHDPISIHYDDDYAVYIPAQREMSLFHAAYADVQELVDEFKKRLQTLLPDEIDLRPYVASISGTYYA